MLQNHPPPPLFVPLSVTLFSLLRTILFLKPALYLFAFLPLKTHFGLNGLQLCRNVYGITAHLKGHCVVISFDKLVTH